MAIRDGSYWNVNSGGIFRKGYSNKKETVVKTEPQQPNNAVSTSSSLSADDKSGITATEPNGEPTVSNGKNTTNSQTTNELDEKSAISVQEQVQAAEAALRDALIDKVREAGIDVITDTEEGQRVLDEANRDERLQAKRRALETASLESNSRSLTVVPSANGAKVLNNLDKLTEDYDKKRIVFRLEMKTLHSCLTLCLHQQEL